MYHAADIQNEKIVDDNGIRYYEFDRVNWYDDPDGKPVVESSKHCYYFIKVEEEENWTGNPSYFFDYSTDKVKPRILPLIFLDHVKSRTDDWPWWVNRVYSHYGWNTKPIKKSLEDSIKKEQEKLEKLKEELKLVSEKL